MALSRGDRVRVKAAPEYQGLFDGATGTVASDHHKDVPGASVMVTLDDDPRTQAWFVDDNLERVL